jgi:YidC/Oxa1 family membrane protein insertase
MDMPDLEKFHIKRSKMFPVHYIYIFHSMFSVHSYLREGAIDNYDTIFCVGEHHVNEIRETEKVYKLKPKELVLYGFPRLDTLIQQQQNYTQINIESKKLVLITPSYGENNLIITIQQFQESFTKIKNECINDLLNVVLQGFISLDIYQNHKENELHSLSLFPKTGIVLTKNTFISEKIIKDSLILKIVNIRDTSNINIEI